MSGGSMNYICWQIEEEADKMGDPELIALVKDVATLMHDREWYLSGDTGDETWKESKEAFKKKWFKSSRASRLKGLIETLFEETKSECMKMIGVNENDQV